MTGYIIPALALSVIINFFLIKRSIKKSKDIKVYKTLAEKNQKAEVKKTEIRNKYDEKETDIKNNNTITNNVVPIDTKMGHNHKHNSPCGKNCPAYTE